MIARKDGAIGWMLFNNPARHNAVSVEMWKAVPEILEEFGRDENSASSCLRASAARPSSPAPTSRSSARSAIRARRRSPTTRRSSGRATRCSRDGGRPRVGRRRPAIADLFRGEVRRTAVLTILVCSVSLTAHWAFLFWYQQHLRNLPDVIDMSPAPEEQLASVANFLVMVAAVFGNFLAAALARFHGLPAVHRDPAPGVRALAMIATYIVPRSHTTLLVLLPVMGALRRRLRAVHDVPAAAVPGPAEDHRGRLLLQHRPHRRGGRNRRIRAVLASGRLPDRPALRRAPLPARNARRPVAARSNRRRIVSPATSGLSMRPYEACV